MVDLSTTVAPKSDQLNADDLIAGPRMIVVRDVKAAGGDEQPVSIFFDGDQGKPFKPSKSMRRVLIHAWGADGARYVGRAMTLYRDETVRFGGQEVGGIRISHLSHIDRATTLALTETKAKRKPFTVKPMPAPAAQEPRQRPPAQRAPDTPPEAEEPARRAPTLAERVETAKGALDQAQTPTSLDRTWSGPRMTGLRDDLNAQEQWALVGALEAHHRARVAALDSVS